MALIKCSECGKEISDKAATCPNCGNPITRAQAAVDVPSELLPFSQPTQIPKKVGWYYFVWIVIITGIITFPANLFHGWEGCFLAIFILFGLPIWGLLSLEVANTRFQVSETQITVLGGILMKYSKTVAFSNAQNVSTRSGPLLRIFHLERLSAWTSSPSQIVIRKGQSSNQPDISLLLNKEDAEQIKEKILEKK